MMQEGETMESRELEQKFNSRVRELGGITYPFGTGYLVILPGGCIGLIFIGPADESQTGTVKRIMELRKLGCAAGRIVEEKHISDAMCYIISRAYRDPDWYRFLAENGRKGESLES